MYYDLLPEPAQQLETVSPPVLETSRLCLRPHRLEDIETLTHMWQRPETVRFIGQKTRNRQEIWQQIQRMRGSWALLGYGYWVIEEKASGQLVGEAGFMDGMRAMTPPISGSPEASWVIDPAFWRQGYARETIGRMLEWADTYLDFAQTVCVIDPAHSVSRKLAEAHRFQWLRHSMLNEAPINVFQRLRQIDQ